MSRKRRRDGPHFVQVFRYLLASPGYQALSLAGRAAFIEVAALYNGNNNGNIAIPARWLQERLGVKSKSTASKVLIELEQKGFVVSTKVGKFTLHTRSAAEYRLTWHRDDRTGHLPTKDFLHYHPGEPDQPKRRPRRPALKVVK